MKVNLLSLKNTLQGNVCEIIFEKRRPKPGDSSQRRMLCTLDQNLLNSVNGRTTLNYKPPSGPTKYNTESKNLLPVWDIMMQGWRMVSMDNCQIVNTIPENEFFEYFNKNIYPMSADEKRGYMGT
jgi:RecB family endonuclease NucS